MRHVIRRWALRQAQDKLLGCRRSPPLNKYPILLDAGIKGILNYTSEHLAVPDNVFVRNVDMLTFLEEIAYFTKA